VRQRLSSNPLALEWQGLLHSCPSRFNGAYLSALIASRLTTEISIWSENRSNCYKQTNRPGPARAPVPPSRPGVPGGRMRRRANDVRGPRPQQHCTFSPHQPRSARRLPITISGPSSDPADRRTNTRDKEAIAVPRDL
jgi:hypothetical protein